MSPDDGSDRASRADLFGAIAILLGASALAFGPGLVLPLTYDFYTQFTLTSPNTPILAASHGTLDSAGSASASFNVPPLALPFPITVHHAYVLIDGGLVSFTSNQVPVELDP